MGQPAAKQGDQITATDTHIILVPSPGGTTPTPLPHPFSGILTSGLSSDVYIEKRQAATKDSVATNTPPHIPQGGSFQKPPSNQGKILMGSATVFINGKPAARNADQAQTCNDPVDLPVGQVIATSTVFIGP
ncbi:MAG: PAAR domain-containing protein [Chloroflexi bacterium]|nr:PAAR domain-containing protein [Chloroflexota bacterium]